MHGKAYQLSIIYHGPNGILIRYSNKEQCSLHFSYVHFIVGAIQMAFVSMHKSIEIMAYPSFSTAHTCTAYNLFSWPVVKFNATINDTTTCYKVGILFVLLCASSSLI